MTVQYNESRSIAPSKVIVTSHNGTLRTVDCNANSKSHTAACADAHIYPSIYIYNATNGCLLYCRPKVFLSFFMMVAAVTF